MTVNEIETSGWTAIIAAVFVGLTQLCGMVLSYLRDKAASKRHEESTARIVDKVNVVEKQTDGMKDELVAAVKAAAFRQGEDAEKAKNGDKS